MNPATRKFHGEKLRLARLFNGWSLEELGSAIGTTRQYIHQLETSAKEPSDDTRNALAQALSVKRTFFEILLINPVQEDQCHFRKRATTPNSLIQQALARGTLIDLFMTEISNLLELPLVDFPDIQVNSLEDVEQAAESCRAHWRLGASGPILNMTRVVENAGAIVTHFDGLSDRIDALSMHRPRPIIVRNAVKESLCRLRFDLAHECGHLVMHRGVETGDRATEEQANRFASAFLLPRNAFAQEFPRGKTLNWSIFYQLKLRWKVSVRAIVRRAYDLGLIDPIQYRRANIYLMKSGQSKIEKYDTDLPLEKSEILTKALALMELKHLDRLCIINNRIGIEDKLLSIMIGSRIDTSSCSINNIRILSHKY